MIKEIEFKEMKKMIEIKELAFNELEQAFAVVSQLRTHLSLEQYIDLVKIMKPNGYQIVCLFENGKIISYAGFAELTNLYYGKHIWVYELVTDKAMRGEGYGGLLLSHIEKYAADKSLNCIALSSGVQREEAHRFYENHGNYEKVSYVFKKNLP
jgi:GNAT superfamily N-acetyltransferase